jgi:hypothetical protein
MSKIKNPIEDFLGGWHRQVTKDCIHIWSDEWMEKMKKQQEKELGVNIGNEYYDKRQSMMKSSKSLRRIGQLLLR